MRAAAGLKPDPTGGRPPPRQCQARGCCKAPGASLLFLQVTQKVASHPGPSEQWGGRCGSGAPQGPLWGAAAGGPPPLLPRRLHCSLQSMKIHLGLMETLTSISPDCLSAPRADHPEDAWLPGKGR